MITERQASMLRQYDGEAAKGNKAAAVIALALRIKVHRACEECVGWGTAGGESSAHICHLCKLAGIVDSDGCVIGSDKPAGHFYKKPATKAGAL